MKDRIRTVDYWYTKVPDKPGEGVRVLTSLRKEGVDLVAMCAFPVGNGEAQLDFVPADAKSMKKAADKMGISLSDRKQAFIVKGPDRAGAAAKTCEKLSAAGISITAAQALTAGKDRWAMILWVKPEDFGKASKALGV